MPVDFPVDEAIDVLRLRMKDTWNLPDYGPIPETGDELVDIQEFGLPFGIIQLESEMEITEGEADRGAAAMDIAYSLRFRCWLIRRKTQNLRDVELLRRELFLFAQTFYGDRQLNKTATWAKPAGMNWGVAMADSPFELAEGESAQAGYVTVELLMVESTL